MRHKNTYHQKKLFYKQRRKRTCYRANMERHFSKASTAEAGSGPTVAVHGLCWLRLLASNVLHTSTSHETVSGGTILEFINGINMVTTL